MVLPPYGFKDGEYQDHFIITPKNPRDLLDPGDLKIDSISLFH